jgi:hypothetical protein
MALVAPSISLAQPTSLERGLLSAVRATSFDEVIDFGPVDDACPYQSWCPAPTPTIAHPPNVDVAVIELGRDGRARAAANVLLSRDYPEGLVVPIDRNLGASAVRFRRWDIDRWNGGTFASDGTQTTTKGWADNPPRTPADDIVAGREQAPFAFMAPTPRRCSSCSSPSTRCGSSIAASSTSKPLTPTNRPEAAAVPHLAPRRTVAGWTG